MSHSKTLLWFRQDLRLEDNPALTYAVQHGKILPIFIHDNINCGKWDMGEASKWWLHHSLLKLNEKLEGHLLCLSGDPQTIIPNLVNQFQCNTVVWNRCYEPWQMKRDKTIKEALKQKGINVKSYNGSLLWEPWEVSKPDGTPYRVFTPFYQKGCLKVAPPRFPLDTPNTFEYVETKGKQSNRTVEHLELLSKHDWHSKFHHLWVPGKDAQVRLSEFSRHKLASYKQNRDFPPIRGTSNLSPYLHFGEISPNQVWYSVINSAQDFEDKSGLTSFLSEMGWREFSYYQLFHFHDLPVKHFQKKFDSFPWKKNEYGFEQWKQGQTGIPIIDAGMRELWQTGNMHNRVRMIVASFLTKNLLIHWHKGAMWFWDCLLDADLASNSASWQWVAGTGADAAPYFRIFNPVTQGQKFDPDGSYVKHYCPELIRLPIKFLHSPWEAPNQILIDADVTLGKTYPHPIVNLKETRNQALSAFKSI